MFVSALPPSSPAHAAFERFKVLLSHLFPLRRRKDPAISRALSRPTTPDLGLPDGAAALIRVACVPAGHDYARALAGWGLTTADEAGVEHLPDPPPLLPADALPSPGQWWPPRMLDAEWITRNRASFDLMHVQFGVEQVSMDALGQACDALRRRGAPLIVTVHDLVNPQFAGDDDAQRSHRDRLDLLIDRADEVITLTPGAATEIADRWHRTAQVIPHPALVSPRHALPSGSPADKPVIAVHLGDLRANVRAHETVVAMIDAAHALRRRGIAVCVRVHLRSQVRDVHERDAVLRASAGIDFVDVIESERHTDAALHSVAADADVCVLPYGHGTHSGWLELYYDLGASVVSADIGYFAQQHDDAGFFFPVAHRDGALEPASLSAALEAALQHAASSRPGSAARARVQHERRASRGVQDRRIRAAHAALYRRALAMVRS